MTWSECLIQYVEGLDFPTVRRSPSVNNYPANVALTAYGNINEAK